MWTPHQPNVQRIIFCFSGLCHFSLPWGFFFYHTLRLLLCALLAMVLSRCWHVPVILREQMFQALSSARLFIDFSCEGGTTLDIIKIISISTPGAASPCGRSTIADCHVRVGSVGCEEKPACSSGFLIVLKRRFLWMTWTWGGQLEMVERVGSHVRYLSLRPSGGGLE